MVGVARTPAHCGEVGCVGGWRDVAERGMRSALIVVSDPAGNRLARMIETEEQALVEKFVAHAAVEALAESVLHRLPRRDEMPDDPVILRPCTSSRASTESCSAKLAAEGSVVFAKACELAL